MSKGITPVVAVILLLLITISIVGFAFIFFQRTTETASQAGQEQLQQQVSQAGTQLRIESVDKNKIYVRNLGTANLNNLALFVNGVKIDSDNPTIAPNTVGTVTLNSAQLAKLPDPAELRVSSGGLPDKITANFYGKNTIAYWTFDDSDGRTVKDVSGNGNDGTFVGETWNDGTLSPACPNCPQQVDGKYGKALKFDGTDDYVSLPSINPTQAITVSLWAKSGSVGYRGQLVSKYQAFIVTSVVTDDPVVYFYLFTTTGDYLGSGYRVPDPQNWHHFVGTYDSSTGEKKFYVDGILRSTQTISGTISADTGPIHIAHQVSSPVGNDHFNGLIDEVRIYNRVLTQQEIQDDMNSAYPIDRTVASYSFEKIVSSQVQDTHNIVKGKYGAAMSFDGLNDYINCGNGASLRPANAITTEFWVKPNEIKGNQFPVAYGDTGFKGWMSDYSNDLMRWLIRNGATIGVASYTLSPSTGVWYHILGTYDNPTLKLYVNGEQKSTATITGPIDYTGLTSCYIGQSESLVSGRYFNGAIDEVRILNVAVS